jgi:hypothetical protein
MFGINRLVQLGFGRGLALSVLAKNSCGFDGEYVALHKKANLTTDEHGFTNLIMVLIEFF